MRIYLVELEATIVELSIKFKKNGKICYYLKFLNIVLE